MSTAPIPTPDQLRFAVRAVTAADLPAIKALHALLFGPGRFTRTAYRVREGTADISPYCLAAVIDGRISAALRFTAITIGGSDKALLLGPLVVAPELAGRGLGRELIRQGLAKANAAGIRLVLLVGDAPYYGPLGFRQVPPGQILMPGPVDPARLLAAELESGALASFQGMVIATAQST